jgi:glycosyltransferase involved in cell wall biosynthesis
LMEQITFRTANIVISTNASYKQVAVERGKKKPEDVFVVRNGPDLSQIHHAQPNENLRNGFTYLVGYVGVIGKQENIEALLQIAEYIVRSKNRTDIKFIIVGTGTHWKEIVHLSQSMGLQRFITFTGFISDQELHQILSTVDVCVNPEFGNEFTDNSTMIKIMEYMSFGKPIVQFYTKEGEVTAGQSAVYVRKNSPQKFAEELISLLEDKDRRVEMGRCGRKRIEDGLSWDSQKCELKKAYDRIFQMTDVGD